MAQHPVEPEAVPGSVQTGEPSEPAVIKDPSPSPSAMPTVEPLKVEPIAPEPIDYKPDPPKSRPEGGFQWKSAFNQSLAWLALQHGYALTQPKTRHALRGPFVKDYINSVRSLHGWDDGGRFFTNYIAHPMQGSFVGYIQVQNDPKGRGEQFGRSGRYWRSRMKAFAWSAAWSTQFEIGPISQASIGNVGQKGKQTWGDIVTTPTVGLGVMVVEDMLDRFVLRRIESRWQSRWIKFLVRPLLNPTRSAANIFQLKRPWYRDPLLR